MSDYLNNLVARTLKLAPVIQPRAASLFEPSSTALKGARSEAETKREDFAAPELPLSASPASPVPVPFAQIESQVAAERERAPRAVQDTPVAPTASRLTMPIDVSPTQSESEPIDLSPTQPESEPIHVSPTQPESDRILIQNPQISQPPYAGCGSDSVPIDATHSHENRIQVQPKIRHFVGEEEFVSDQVIRPARSSAKIAETKDALPLVPARTVIARPAVPAEPRQTVSVTIGRVDVRATFPAAPAQRIPRAQHPAAMSLEAYRKSRSEGRR